MVGHSDGSGDTGVEGVEPFLRREEKVVARRVVWADVLFSASLATRGLKDQDLRKISCGVGIHTYNGINDRDAGR